MIAFGFVFFAVSIVLSGLYRSIGMSMPNYIRVTTGPMFMGGLILMILGVGRWLWHVAT